MLNLHTVCSFMGSLHGQIVREMGANLQPWSTFGVLLWPDSAKSRVWKCQWNRLQMNLGEEMTKSP